MGAWSLVTTEDTVSCGKKLSWKTKTKTLLKEVKESGVEKVGNCHNFDSFDSTCGCAFGLTDDTVVSEPI